MLDFPPERIQLLKELGKNYRIFLFSNTNALHLSHLQQIYRNTFTEGELDDHFERAYYSHTLKMRKPDIESFQYILKENQLKGEETLFVDDALINVEGAEKAGLKGLFLRPAPRSGFPSGNNYLISSKINVFARLVILGGFLVAGAGL